VGPGVSVVGGARLGPTRPGLEVAR
jgi:hypothetical protein